MKFYYINLDTRTDRDEQIRIELEGLDYVRVPAIHNNNIGILGCVQSHIKTLEMFIESGEEMCAILEDDFMFTRPKEELVTSIETEWDVIMLSGNVKRCVPFNKYVNKVIDAQTTSGYMVRKSFAPILLQNFKEGHELLSKNPRLRDDYSIDMYWKKLQPDSRWFIFNPKFGRQRPGYSDIEKGFFNYGV